MPPKVLVGSLEYVNAYTTAKMGHNRFYRHSIYIGRNKPQLSFGKERKRAKMFSLIQFYTRKLQLNQTGRKHLRFSALRSAEQRKLRTDRYVQIQPLPIGSQIIAEGQFKHVRQKLYRTDMPAVTDLLLRELLHFIKPVKLFLRKLPVMQLQLYVVVKKA